MHSRPLAQLDDLGWLFREAPEEVAIGAQRVGEHHGVAAVVLGAGDRESIAEAIELLWVDREDDEAAVEQCLNHRAVRHLDRHRDGRGSVKARDSGGLAWGA